jgi:rRNA maturation RNase YbeY
MRFSIPADAGPSVLIEHDHPTLHLDGTTLRTLVHRIAYAEGRALGTVSIVLTDHDTVLALNRDYLGHDYVTDVLSFDLSAEDASHVEGEIYVDLDTAAERHEDFGVSFEDEARRYVVHGTLHLMGYDDSNDSQQAEMRRLEDQFLATVR